MGNVNRFVKTNDRSVRPGGTAPGVGRRVEPVRVQRATDAHRVASENVEAARMVERQTDAIASGLEAPRDVVDAFAAQVRDALGEGILRYDQRTALYRQAAAMKIDRFEASLIIAAIEHRHGLNATPRIELAPRRRGIAAWVAGLLAIELVAGAVAAMVLLR